MLLLLVVTGARAQLPSSATDLLQLAKTLADSGRLDDPGSVAHTLHTSFSAHLRPQAAFSCNNGSPFPSGRAEAHFVTLYEPPKDFWFRVSPGSATSGTAGNPTFRYSVDKIVACGAGGVARHTTEANLEFARIPGFACMSETQIRSILPHLSRPGTAANGPLHLRYSGVSAGIDFDPPLVEQRGCYTGIHIQAVHPDR